jgi:osmoprotectant transport system permease protein
MTADLLPRLEAHVALCAAALTAAALVGIPLGAVAAHAGRLRAGILSAVNVARVVPSLAVLTLVLPVLGIGLRAAAVALALLAVPPIAINTDLGFRAVPQAALDAARGLGMTPRQMRRQVEWPLAFPIIFAGFRTAAVEVIASASLAAFIGGGGLGEYIVDGLANNNEPSLLLGGAAVAGLALLTELVLGTAERKLAFGGA